MTEGVFLYYLPGRKFTAVTPTDLAENPLLSRPFFELVHSPKLFKTKLIGTDVLNRGPDNGDGCVIGVQAQVATDQIPHYNRDAQTWRKFTDTAGGVHWIGYQTDMKPGPESLRRASQFTGYETELGDGKVWIAPTIRAYQAAESVWQSRLPMAWGIGDDMQPTAEPLERFKAAWEMSASIWAAVFGGAGAKFTDCFAWAVDSLSLNYRVGPAEASILGLMTDDTMLSVLHAAVDEPLVTEVMKGPEQGNPT